MEETKTEWNPWKLEPLMQRNAVSTATSRDILAANAGRSPNPKTGAQGIRTLYATIATRRGTDSQIVIKRSETRGKDQAAEASPPNSKK